MTDALAGRITPDEFDAVLFDLDGVLTKTASVHAAAWKRMFDEYLRARAEHDGSEFVAFDADADYTRYVDGKPRYDGVRSFLESRDIHLPDGTPDDPPDAETVCGLGNRKNELVQKILETEGVEAFPGSIKLLHQIRESGIKTAVVSSSKNCVTVIKAAGIADQFDQRVDGEVAAELGLAGKPAPDTYLEAAKELGVEPARAVVFEDALSGVESGRAGNFGLVVGVDRKGDADALKRHGADIVVQDLAQLLAPS